MQLAHFVHRYPPALGGAEAYFARLTNFCAMRGSHVTVFTSDARDLTAFWSRRGARLPAGVEHHRVGEGTVSIRRYPLLRFPGRRIVLKTLGLYPSLPWQCLCQPCSPISLRMWRDAGQEPAHFDAVHATAFPYSFPIACAWRLARRLGVPFLLTPFLHLGDPTQLRDRTRRSYTSGPLRWLLREADAVFVQTPSEAQAARELGVPEGRLYLQGLGVDPGECTGGDRAAARHRWGAADSDVVIGHLANLSYEKGSIDLLKAAARLWERGVGARVVLAGPEMPNFQRFWRTLAAHPHRHRVLRLGPLSEQAKREFFAGIDLFALPSRSDSFGLVLLEAWANGAPSVAYRAGGVADVIRHGQDGLLAPCGNLAQLGDALELLVLNPARRASMGASGKSRLARDFRWPEKLEKVFSVQCSVFSGQIARPASSALPNACSADTDATLEPLNTEN